MLKAIIQSLETAPNTRRWLIYLWMITLTAGLVALVVILSFTVATEVLNRL